MIRRALLAAALSLACTTPRVHEATPPPPQPPPATHAQGTPVERSRPVDRPLVTDGDVSEAWVSGMQILVKRLPSADLVSGSLVVKGGVRNWDERTAGIEQLALNVADSGGTTSLDKDAFARKLASLGSEIGAGAGFDYAAFSFKALARNWEETFGLTVDTFLRPAMPASEIELQRTRQLQALKREQEFPDSRLGLAAHEWLFKGHPYANRPVGRAETVSAFTRDQLLEHLAKLRQTTRLMLVVVGNVDPARVVALAKEQLGSLPAGDWRDEPVPPLAFQAPDLLVVPAELPTNYITGIFLAPSWSDPDYPKAMVSLNVLHFLLWDEVRTKRNLSYAPGAGATLASQVPRGSIYVTATDPGTTVTVMLEDARLLASTPMPADKIEGNKAVFLTGFLMANETTDGQAAFLVKAQIYGRDWRLTRALPDRVRAVTPEDVRDFAKKYVKNLHMVVLGNPAKIDPALFKSL